jgi:hypothetical protein
MSSARAALGLIVLASLLACKGSKKKDETRTTSVATSPPPKLRFRPSASQLEGVCEGKAVTGLEPLPRDKTKGALFVRQPGAKFEHIDYDSIEGHRTNLAVTLDDATVVACLDITKKKKNKSCFMTALDPTKGGGTLLLYEYGYTVTVRETETGKVLSEEKKTRSDKKCPDFHAFKKSEEDLELPTAVIADLAIGRYRDGK